MKFLFFVPDACDSLTETDESEANLDAGGMHSSDSAIKSDDSDTIVDDSVTEADKTRIPSA